MMNLRDKGGLHDSKEEEEAMNTSTTASASSRQWSSGIKNSRIVRVSRTFGGKDRHSKVCTIKGLRDRRIRLSVPTAIQLYDLQDRLGLGQPSKVIDWLLDITKHEIDKLPPLSAIPGTFAHPYQQALLTREYGMPPFVDHEEQGRIREGNDHCSGSCQVLAQNFFPIASGNSSSNAGVLSNHPMYNYSHWDPTSNLSLAQLGNLGLSSQNDHQHQHQHQHQQGHSSNNSSSLPSPLALSSMPSTSSIYPQLENDVRQFNRSHFSSISPYYTWPLYTTTSTGLGLKPFPFSMSHHPHPHPHLHQSEDDHDRQHEKNNIDDGSWNDSSRD